MFAWDTAESHRFSREVLASDSCRRDNSKLSHSVGEGPDEVPDRQQKIDRAYWTFQLFALIYNLEHGIIPAALPQIRHYYNTTALLEACTQCASVFGTQLGVCLVTTYKVPLNKFLALTSLALVGVCCFGTRMVRLNQEELDQSLPLELFLWRFAAGLCASYCINLIPRWINTVYPEENSIRQAHFQAFGIVGTIAGYALALSSPADTPVWPDAWLIPFRAVRQQMENTTLGRHGVWLASALSEPLDFRRAFLWAGCLAFVAVFVGIIALDRSYLFMPSTPRPVLEDLPSEEGRISLAGASTERIPIGTNIPNSPMPITASEQGNGPVCVVWAPLLNATNAVLRPTTTQEDLKELFHLREFVGLVSCVWINTTTAQAVSFWLFTSYTIGMQTSTLKATLGVGLVFVIGTVSGLYLATSLQPYINKSSRAVNSITVPPQLLEAVVILCGFSSVFGATIFFVKSFWPTTLIFMLAVVFGSAIIPIAQSAIGMCTPPHLHETAYGVHQFAFQSTWFCGPLLPVFVGWVSGERVETFGLRSVVVFPAAALFIIWRAWEYRKRMLNETEGFETELVPLAPK